VVDGLTNVQPTVSATGRRLQAAAFRPVERDDAAVAALDDEFVVTVEAPLAHLTTAGRLTGDPGSCQPHIYITY